MKKSIFVLSAVVLMVTGCANSGMTKDDLAALRADVAAAKEAAQQANLNAQDAKAMSMRTEEKLNRVFRKAQMK